MDFDRMEMLDHSYRRHDVDVSHHASLGPAMDSENFPVVPFCSRNVCRNRTQQFIEDCESKDYIQDELGRNQRTKQWDGLCQLLEIE